MKKTLKLLIFITLAAASCGGNTITEFRAYTEAPAVSVHPGEASSVTVKIEIPKGSHIYGNPKGPGIGKPTTVTASGPKSIAFGETRYPAAERYTYPGEKDFVFVYSGAIEIVVTILANKNAATGDYPASIELDALLCTDASCIPKKTNIPFTIKVLTPAEQPAIAENTKTGAVTPSIPQSRETVTPGASAPKEHKDYFGGITFSPRCIGERKVTGLMQAIVLALIAGFILNFMPCVLPVVSLKIMGFVKHAGSDRRRMIVLGSLFSAGILSSFTVLAALAAYFGYSWGALFQHGMFLIVMAAIVFALALSMFGLYTLNIPSFAGKASGETQSPYGDAFIKGLLATLLATPCSGPFLGGTLAWALLQPPHVIFIIFMSVGAGMALPYMLLSAFPGLLRFIPRAGRWTETFEHAMAFLLVFTAVYLLSLLETGSLLPAVTFMAFIALGLWQYGRFGSAAEKTARRTISLIVLVLIVSCGYALSFHYLYSAKTAEIPASPFSEERVMANRNSGRISLIQFTADWCPNCRLVEARSLRTNRVARIVREKRIDYMVADITRDNPPAERLLYLLGSRSIPVLAVMPAGEDFNSPLCLRDIYSEKDVLEAIDLALPHDE